MMKKLEQDIQKVYADVCQYNEKPNKSLSGRIRKQLGEIKKDVTDIRKHLVESDARGY